MLCEATVNSANITGTRISSSKTIDDKLPIKKKIYASKVTYQTSDYK